MSAQLLAREGDYAQIRMPSGEVRRVAVICYATVGQIGNVEHENENVGKAGKSRWRGKRPAVRGMRSEEHTSELQSPYDLVCRLLLEKKKRRKPIFIL